MQIHHRQSNIIKTEQRFTKKTKSLSGLKPRLSVDCEAGFCEDSRAKWAFYQSMLPQQICSDRFIHAFIADVKLCPPAFYSLK